MEGWMNRGWGNRRVEGWSGRGMEMVATTKPSERVLV